jgi:uncharacterized RDD family membrane protein YckC
VIDALLVVGINYAVVVALRHSSATWLDVSLLSLLLDLLYGAVLIHVWGSTLGMRIVRVRAVDRVSCENLPWSRALMRALCAAVLVSALPLMLHLIGALGSTTSVGHGDEDMIPLLSNLGVVTFIWAKYDPLGRTLQDIAAGSVVLATAKDRSKTVRFRAATRRCALSEARTHRAPVLRHDHQRPR